MLFRRTSGVYANFFPLLIFSNLYTFYFSSKNTGTYSSKKPANPLKWYGTLRESKHTVSTWLDCFRWMSDFCVRSREFIKACFFHKIHPFLPLCVLGNRSTPLLLPIIYKHTVLPTASRPRSDGTGLKSHRLNLNSSRDRICTFFRFRMDMDHYVLSSLASLLFPEP